MKRPLILISNDDGIDSPYLDLLVEAALSLGECVIVAPAKNQSSMGRSYPSGGLTGIITKVDKAISGEQVEAYAVEGSPALVVCHAMTEILQTKPDLCLTGINRGENVGSTMHASGTLMGAIEANSFGMPAIAFSKRGSFKEQEESLRYWVHKIASRVINEGLPQTVAALSVNFPEKTSRESIARVTRLSSQIYYESVGDKKRDWSKPYDLPSERKYNLQTLEKDSDIYALVEEKNISITPISWDFTAHGHQEDIRLRLGI